MAEWNAKCVVPSSFKSPCIFFLEKSVIRGFSFLYVNIQGATCAGIYWIWSANVSVKLTFKANSHNNTQPSRWKDEQWQCSSCYRHTDTLINRVWSSSLDCRVFSVPFEKKLLHSCVNSFCCMFFKMKIVLKLLPSRWNWKVKKEKKKLFSQKCKSLSSMVIVLRVSTTLVDKGMSPYRQRCGAGSQVEP